MSVDLPLPDVVEFSSTTVIDQQIAQLRAISVKLKMAVGGMDANWIDSGSGVLLYISSFFTLCRSFEGSKIYTLVFVYIYLYML